jgi:hypothetical protein
MRYEGGRHGDTESVTENRIYVIPFGLRVSVPLWLKVLKP